MKFAGIDHGTTSIRILLGEEWIEIPRGGVIPEIDFSGYFFGICYSLGDKIVHFTPLNYFKGPEELISPGGGEFVGTGTEVLRKVFREADGVLIPGVHRRTPTLDPRISRMYSHICAPDKVAEAFYVRKFLGLQDFILVDASSNVVSLAVREGKIVGGLDAPILSPGMRQGPLDVEGLRIAERIGAIKAFELRGLLNRYTRQEALESLELGIEMEAFALFPIAKVKTLVIGGKEGILCFEKVRDFMLDYGWEVRKVPYRAPAIGAREIAREVWEGSSEILGLKVLRSSSFHV